MIDILYSTKIKFGNEEYMVKIGIREAIKLGDRGIDIVVGTSIISEVMDILTVGLECNKDLFIRDNGQKMSFDSSKEKVLTMFEESGLPYPEVVKIINEAQNIAIFKRKNEKKTKKEKN